MTCRAEQNLVLNERALSQAVAHELAGAPDARDAIVWASEGSEVVLHLDSIEVHLTPGHLHVHLDCETNETGRVAQEIHLALAHLTEAPNFTATADLAPHGDERVAARWGPVLQDAVWGAVVGLAGDEAQGVAADDGTLVVHLPSPAVSNHPRHS